MPELDYIFKLRPSTLCHRDSLSYPLTLVNAGRDYI